MGGELTLEVARLKTLKFSKSVNIDSATWLRTCHLELADDQPQVLHRAAPPTAP